MIDDLKAKIVMNKLTKTPNKINVKVKLCETNKEISQITKSNKNIILFDGENSAYKTLFFNSTNLKKPLKSLTNKGKRDINIIRHFLLMENGNK